MATKYLPIKLKASGHHRAKRKSNTPARSSRAGHRTRSNSTTVSRKRHLAGLKAARTRKAHERASHRTNRPKSHRKSGRRSNLPRGFAFTARESGGRFKPGWTNHSQWMSPSGQTFGPRSKRRANGYKSRGKRRSNGGRGIVKYRNRTVVVHKTKRMRNPVGFDSNDSLKSLGTWGKIGLGVIFGLSGLIVAFGIPKALAVITGSDSFQRGWGGVGTAAVASLLVGLGVGMVSKRGGLGLLVAAGVGVALLALNAASPTVAQMVIPLNEATLAAMLPTFTPAPGSPQAMLANAQAQAQTLANQTAVGNDYQRAGFHGQGKKGPSDFYPGTPNTPSALTGTTNSFYGSPLKSKEKF